jgi:TldD protein
MRNVPEPLPFIDHFGLSEGDLGTTLVFALSRGGDFAETFLEYRAYDFIHMEDDIIKETAETIGVGMGIRVLSGDKTGFGYTNDLSLEKVQKAALTAASIAAGKFKAAPLRFRHSSRRPSCCPVLRPAHTAGMGKKIALVREAYGAARSFDPKIQKVKASLQDSVQYVVVANSEGLLVRDVRRWRRR